MGHPFPAFCGAQDHNCNGQLDDAEQIADLDTYGETHCGACDSPCSGAVPHGLAQCMNTGSAIVCGAACDSGWADCSSAAAGCELEVLDPNLYYYPDADGDGYGELGASGVYSCGGTPPANTVNDDTDCDDGEAAINPAAVEMCDTVDNDCDTNTDEGVPPNAPTWYEDSDGDGYGNPAVTQVACSVAGFVDNADDCDDAQFAWKPGVPDAVCDDLDQDCDGVADEDHPDTDTPGDGVDEDCDGFDFDLAGSIFVADDSAADCTGTGQTPDDPCLNLQAALDLANTQGKVVIAAPGDYDLEAPVQLVDGVSIYGGFNLSTGQLVGKAVFNRLAGSSDSVAMVGNQINSPTVVANVVLEARTPTGPGLSAYGLICDGCGGLTLDEVDINAEPGTSGSPGTSGTTGAKGSTGANGTYAEGVEQNGGGGGTNYQKGGNGGPSGGCAGSTLTSSCSRTPILVPAVRWWARHEAPDTLV